MRKNIFKTIIILMSANKNVFFKKLNLFILILDWKICYDYYINYQDRVIKLWDININFLYNKA